MSSASELFYTRRSRVSRSEERGLDLDGIVSDRDRQLSRRSVLRRRLRRHFTVRDDMDPSRRRRPLFRSEDEPPQSNVNSLGELDVTSSIDNGSISSNRLFSTSNGQLPATVLEARARLLERIRGISISQNRPEDIASGLTWAEESGRNSLDSGRARGISITGTRRGSGSSSEDLLYDLATIDGFVFQIRSQLASARDLIRRSRGLSSEAISNLLHEVFTEAEHAGDVGRQCDCSVCLESFKEGDGLLSLHCGHRFHCACLEPWLRTCGDCPYCRARI